MAIPRTRLARLFYQSAEERFKDATFLLASKRTTGAIYLAGYSVECMLKALILSITPKKEQEETLDSFRGAKAHDYGWLRKRYFDKGGPDFPSAVSSSFTLVNTWTTELRYKAGTSKPDEAKAFLLAAKDIMIWANARF